MNNIQKAFRDKSKLRKMADGGIFGNNTIGENGEGIYKEMVDGVPTFTDERARGSRAVAYTPAAFQEMGNFITNHEGKTLMPGDRVTQSGAPSISADQEKFNAMQQARMGMQNAQSSFAAPTGSTLAPPAVDRTPDPRLAPQALPGAAAAPRWQSTSSGSLGPMSVAAQPLPANVAQRQGGAAIPGGRSALRPMAEVLANPSYAQRQGGRPRPATPAPRPFLGVGADIGPNPIPVSGKPPRSTYQKAGGSGGLASMDSFSDPSTYRTTRPPTQYFANGGEVKDNKELAQMRAQQAYEAYAARNKNGPVERFIAAPAQDDKEWSLGEAWKDRAKHRIGQIATNLTQFAIENKIDKVFGPNTEAAIQQRRGMIKDAVQKGLQALPAATAASAIRAFAPRLVPGLGAAALGKQVHDELQPGGMLTRPENPVQIRMLPTGGSMGGQGAPAGYMELVAPNSLAPPVAPPVGGGGFMEQVASSSPPRTRRSGDPEVEYSTGGEVDGPGGPTDDKINAKLSDGEFVVRAAAVDAIGVDTLNELNKLGGPMSGKGDSPLRRRADGNVHANRGGQYLNPDVLRNPLDPRVVSVDPAGNAQVGNSSAQRGLVPAGERVSSSSSRALSPAGPRIDTPGVRPEPRGFNESTRPRDFVNSAERFVNGNNGSKLAKVGRTFGRAAPTLAAVTEGVAAARDWEDLDGWQEKGGRVAEGVARGTGAIAGAGIGASIGSVIPVVGTTIGLLAGGTAGYLAPDAANWAANKLGITDDNELASTTAARRRAERIDNMQRSQEPAPEAPVEQAAPAQRAGPQLLAAPAAAPAAPRGLNPLQLEAVDAARSQLREGARNPSYNSWVPNRDTAINKRYDQRIKELSRMYSAKGQGNLARHIVELEASRSRELSANQQALVSTAGQSASATSALRGQNMSGRNSAMRGLAAMGNTESMNANNAMMANARDEAAKISGYNASVAGIYKSETDRLKNAAEQGSKAEKQRYERELGAMEQIKEQITSRYGDDVDKASEVLSRILSAGKGQVGVIASLGPQDQAAAVEQLVALAEIAQGTDEYQNVPFGFDGDKDSGLPQAKEIRDLQFTDMGEVGVLRTLGTKLTPFTDKRMIVDDTGRLSPLPDDRRLARAARTSANRSKLRENNN